MLDTNYNKEQKMIFVVLLLFYVIFFINLIMDARSNWSLSYVLLLLSIYSVIRFKKIKLKSSVLIVSFTSMIIITGLELFVFNSKATEDQFFNEVSRDYIQQFAFICIFAFIPFLFSVAHFGRRHFEYLVISAIVFSLFYNIYLNFNLDFSRALLANHFKSVILYDYCISALSLIGLVFSFQYSKKWSYILISFCLLNLSMIVLHGSRGAWIGIPIILVFIAFYFYKTKLPRTLFMLASSLLLTISLVYLPHSPIEERIEHLKSDTVLIQEKQNYNSSVGTRLALWQFSWEQFKSSPWIGQGITGFRNQICDPTHREAVPNCQPHAHNMIFQSIAAYGLIGLIHLIIIYFYPLWIFIHRLVSSTSSKESKYIAMAATVFMVYLGISGLSDYLFYFEFPTMFYFLILITFLTLLSSQKLPSTSNSFR